MTRVLRMLGLAVGGLAVLALGLGTSDLSAEAAGAGPGSVVRTAQKTKAKKKVRGKRGAPKADADKADEPAEKGKPAADAPADGTLKFSRDIAPIFVNNCVGCHNARQKRGKLDMTSFEALMQGTPKEKVIDPGKPDESHLVLRVKGEETPKMPQGANRNLSEAAIAKIEQWVKAGAVLDAGIDPKAPMESYAASPEDLRKMELSKMSPEQRDKQVEAVGRERWKKASPKTNPEVVPSAHFLLFSTLPKDRANAAVKAVENQYGAVKGLLGPAAVEWGEKVSLFVFNDAAAFSEFVRSIEQRDAEPDDPGTSRLTIPQPYVAVVDPLGGRDDPGGTASAGARKAGRSRKGSSSADDAPPGGATRTLPGVLTEQFVIGTAGRTGKPPRWLSLGLGAMIASRVEGRSPYYQKIRRDAYQLWELGWQSKAQEALGDATKTEDVRAVGFAVLEWLSSVNRSVIPPFINGMLAGGDKLDDVIANVLNGTREQFLANSGEFVGTRMGGR